MADGTRASGRPGPLARSGCRFTGPLSSGITARQTAALFVTGTSSEPQHFIKHPEFTPETRKRFKLLPLGCP